LYEVEICKEGFEKIKRFTEVLYKGFNLLRRDWIFLKRKFLRMVVELLLFLRKRNVYGNTLLFAKQKRLFLDKSLRTKWLDLGGPKQLLLS
jgi:hypothetical protein